MHANMIDRVILIFRHDWSDVFLCSHRFRKFSVLFWSAPVCVTFIVDLLEMYPFPDVRGVYVLCRKYVWGRLCALIDSTHSGDHFLKVSAKSHFSFSLCWWVQHERSERKSALIALISWFFDVRGVCLLRKKYFWPCLWVCDKVSLQVCESACARVCMCK